MKIFLSIVLSFYSITNLLAQQTETETRFQLSALLIKANILIDGNLNEGDWQKAEATDEFWEKFPEIKAGANPKTEMKVMYNDKFIYIGATCWDRKDHIIQTLRRDEDYFSSDAIAILLDPVNKKTNGFLFGVSPAGVQTEAIVSIGGRRSLNEAWDNKWFAAVKQYEDRWTVEMAIPLKSLRFESNQKQWGINFVRNQIKDNQYHTWTEVPQQFRGIDLGYTGLLNFPIVPQKPKWNAALIPYVSGAYVDDQEFPDAKNYQSKIGLDAKLALSSSMNLDLTINPDFSQIEVDDAVTNLTRFSIFLPEKRTFFLENSDLFSGFGIRPVRPFFSRRIGLNENNEAVPVLGGLRLSGNLNPKTRLGLMNIQTKATDILAGNNYTAVAASQNLFGRTFIKGIFLNRQGFQSNEFVNGDYSRNASLEFRYSSLDGNYGAWAGYHRSFKPGIAQDDFFHGGASYKGKVVDTFVSLLSMGTDYYADMGFIARIENYDAVRDTTIRQGFSQGFWDFSLVYPTPNHSFFNRHRISMSNFVAANPDFDLVERSTELKYGVRLKSRARFDFEGAHRTINLQFPFRFTGDEFEALPVATYNFANAELKYRSDERKLFNFELGVRAGGFYNGEIITFRSKLNLRLQPWGRFSVAYERNNLAFPEAFGDRVLDLVQLRSEISFSNKINWTSILQYNAQGGELGINSRIQYRYAPMSDLFLVYSDHYIDEGTLQPSYRTIVLKWNYWLTI